MLRIEIRDINQCGRHPRDFGYSRTHCSNFAIKNLGHPQEIESPRPPFKTLRGRVCDIFWSPAAPSAVCNIDTTGMGKMLLLRLTLAPAQPTCVCVCVCISRKRRVHRKTKPEGKNGPLFSGYLWAPTHRQHLFYSLPVDDAALYA